MIMLFTLIAYFLLLLLVSRITSKGADNNTFFLGNRQSPWYLVAFGMIGASISGITFVSVPGMVEHLDMTYLQMCLGFIAGYLIVAYVLLPIYYKHGLTTIYGYLDHRLGRSAYRTGASFFILSKLANAAARFYVVAIVLQHYVFARWHLPFALTVLLLMTLIWLYTRKGGIKTLVWTDTLQTFCMLVALVLIIFGVVQALGWSAADTLQHIREDAHFRIFVFDDWVSKQNFWKQFFSGIFIVVVMTGLDQDMMQKNLTCKSLQDARKDMCTYGFAFVPVNFLFLLLGILLLHLSARTTHLPIAPDQLLPYFAATGRLGDAVVVCFTLGVVAASFSSADSALTALTTSCCVDLLRNDSSPRLRRRVHLLMSAAFAACVLIFDAVNSTSVIDAIYTVCGYTYGPLLGLYAFAYCTSGKPHPSAVLPVCVAAPLLCMLLHWTAERLWHYSFGYEMLMINGFCTFIGLWLSARGTHHAVGTPSEHRSNTR